MKGIDPMFMTVSRPHPVRNHQQPTALTHQLAIFGYEDQIVVLVAAANTASVGRRADLQIVVDPHGANRIVVEVCRPFTDCNKN